MNRDMSYSLDGAFSTRNQGQLISAKRIQTQTMRTPGLVPIKDTAKGGMGVPLTNRNMVPREGRGVGAFDVTLPIIGSVHWGSLALGSAVGVMLLMLLRRKKKGLKGKLASALASS